MFSINVLAKQKVKRLRGAISPESAVGVAFRRHGRLRLGPFDILSVHHYQVFSPSLLPAADAHEDMTGKVHRVDVCLSPSEEGGRRRRELVSHPACLTEQLVKQKASSFGDDHLRSKQAPSCINFSSSFGGWGWGGVNYCSRTAQSLNQCFT